MSSSLLRAVTDLLGEVQQHLQVTQWRNYHLFITKLTTDINKMAQVHILCL